VYLSANKCKKYRDFIPDFVPKPSKVQQRYKIIRKKQILNQNKQYICISIKCLFIGFYNVLLGF